MTGQNRADVKVGARVKIVLRVYLKSPIGASFGGKSALPRRFSLGSTQDSCKKTACMTPFSLEIHTTQTFQIHPKADQATGRLTEGVVMRLLTRSSFHPHGIKVMLEDGRVGRVREIAE